MTDLWKWDFASEFRLYEAAALIAGIDPAVIVAETEPAKDNPRIFDYHDNPKIKPVVERMMRSFFSALDLYSALQKGVWGNSCAEPQPELVLRSAPMELIPMTIENLRVPLDANVQDALNAWANSGEDPSIYETEKFSRKELSRWLTANRLRSVYEFAQIPAAGDQHPDRSLGTKERHTLLVIIAALCVEAKCDYQKVAKTAGTIRNVALAMGVSIGETTIESHLKRIPDALAARTT